MPNQCVPLQWWFYAQMRKRLWVLVTMRVIHEVMLFIRSYTLWMHNAFAVAIPVVAITLLCVHFIPDKHLQEYLLKDASPPNMWREPHSWILFLKMVMGVDERRHVAFWMIYVWLQLWQLLWQLWQLWQQWQYNDVVHITSRCTTFIRLSVFVTCANTPQMMVYLLARPQHE